MAGAVNYISTGVVWAQSSSGSAQASVDAIKIADSKAQSLFDNCFSIVDGPFGTRCYRARIE
nr:hypothetical protein [Bacteroidota bacterium]